MWPWKSIGIIYSLRATPAPSLVLIKCRGQTILSGQHRGLRRVVWPWPLNMWPWKLIWIIYSFRATPAQSLVLIKWRCQSILSGQHRGLKSALTLTFEHLTLKINRDHLLIEGNPCTKFGIDQVKGQTILSGQHRGLRRVVWPWPLNMWPWKSIGIIYSLRATPAPSLVLIKWRSQKILSGQHLVYRPT